MFFKIYKDSGANGKIINCLGPASLRAQSNYKLINNPITKNQYEKENLL